MVVLKVSLHKINVLFRNISISEHTMIKKNICFNHKLLVTQKLENNKRTCTISIVICPWVSPQSRYSLFKRLLRGHDSLRGCWNIVKNIRMRKRTHNIYLSRLCLRVQYWPQSGLTVMYGLKKTNSTKYSGFWY